jgi:hypothetical protein
VDESGGSGWTRKGRGGGFMGVRRSGKRSMEGEEKEGGGGKKRGKEGKEAKRKERRQPESLMLF